MLTRFFHNIEKTACLSIRIIYNASQASEVMNKRFDRGRRSNLTKLFSIRRKRAQN